MKRSSKEGAMAASALEDLLLSIFEAHTIIAYGKRHEVLVFHYFDDKAERFHGTCLKLNTVHSADTLRDLLVQFGEDIDNNEIWERYCTGEGALPCSP
jgi:hypothetical protein